MSCRVCAEKGYTCRPNEVTGPHNLELITCPGEECASCDYTAGDWSSDEYDEDLA